jgi:hypothetical protein
VVTFEGKIIEGEIMSARARKLIRAWARLHQSELEMNWRRAKALKQLVQIPPLE